MELEPRFWPHRVSDLRESQRPSWRAYWEEDLLPLRASYPELAHWDDRALIGALTDFGRMILGRHQIYTDRDTRFLDWIQLSCRSGVLLDEATFCALHAGVAKAMLRGAIGTPGN